MTGLVSIYQHAFQSSYGSTTRATATGGISGVLRSKKPEYAGLDFDAMETTALEAAHNALVAAHNDLDKAVEETRKTADAQTALHLPIGGIADATESSANN